MVEIQRKQIDAIDLLKDMLKDGGRDLGIARLVADQIKKSHKIFVNEEILDFYTSNISFAKFLTEFIIGRPHWLVQPA